MDELNPESKELCEEPLLHQSPTASENIYKFNLRSSMNRNIISKREEEKKRLKQEDF